MSDEAMDRPDAMGFLSYLEEYLRGLVWYLLGTRAMRKPPTDEDKRVVEEGRRAFFRDADDAECPYHYDEIEKKVLWLGGWSRGLFSVVEAEVERQGVRDPAEVKGEMFTRTVTRGSYKAMEVLGVKDGTSMEFPQEDEP